METSLKNKLHAFLISFRPNQNCFEMRLASEPQIQQSPFTGGNFNQNDSCFFEEVLLLFVMRAAAMTLIFLFTLVTHTHTSTDWRQGWLVYNNRGWRTLDHLNNSIEQTVYVDIFAFRSSYLIEFQSIFSVTAVVYKLTRLWYIICVNVHVIGSVLIACNAIWQKQLGWASPYRILRTGGTAAASALAASLEIFPNPSPYQRPAAGLW